MTSSHTVPSCPRIPYQRELIGVIWPQTRKIQTFLLQTHRSARDERLTECSYQAHHLKSNRVGTCEGYVNYVVQNNKRYLFLTPDRARNNNGQFKEKRPEYTGVNCMHL